MTFLRTRARARVALAVGGMLVLILPACGGGDDDAASDDVASLSDDTSAGGTAPATTVAGDVEQQYLEWAECMAGEGVTVPELTVDAEGNPQLLPPNQDADSGEAPFDREAMAEATEVCGEIPEGLVGGLEEGDRADLEDAALEFAQCMRDHGVDVPDPDFSNPAAGGGLFGDAIDEDDPAVQAALEACDDVLGGVGPGGGPDTTEAP